MRRLRNEIRAKAKVRVRPVGGGAHGVRQRGDFFEIGVFLNPNHKPETPEILEILEIVESLEIRRC